jgi:TetR/AcrR family transcriptional repressor of nem operon
MARPRTFDEERVLDAVMEAFWMRGYEATSAQDLVDASGVGRSSLYNAYSSKEGLFERALQRYRHNTLDNLKALEADAPIRMRIRRLLEGAVFPDTPNRGKRGCLATNTAIESGHRPNISRLVRQNFDLVEAVLARELSNARSAGEISANRNPADLAKFFVTTLQGLRVMASVTPERERDALRRVIDVSLEVLA